MKPTKANLLALAKRTGCTVRIDQSIPEVCVEAPPAHHFTADVHEHVYSDWHETMAERYGLAIEDIEFGFERCDTDTCGAWGDHSDHDNCCGWWGPEEVKR